MTRRLPRFRAGRAAVLTAVASLFLVAAMCVDEPEPLTPTTTNSTLVPNATAFDVLADEPPPDIPLVPISSTDGFDEPVASLDLVDHKGELVEIPDVRPSLATDGARQQVLILPRAVAQELRETGSLLMQTKNQRVRLAPGILIATPTGNGTMNISGKVASAKVIRGEQAVIVIDGVITEPERIEPGQEPSPLVIVNGVIIGTAEAYLQGQVTAEELEAAEVIRSGKDFERFGRRIIWVTKQVEAPAGGVVKLLSPRLTVRPPAHPSDTRQPLYVVDGVVVSRSANLQGMSSADIESIEVIKGPEAIVRFGSDARDGVILITTKQEKPIGLRSSASEVLKELTVRTTGANAPLIVVDGVVMNGTTDLESEALKRLEIEAIEIIKGAAAEKLYGTRAAYGVISIITKKGNVRR